MDVTLKRKDGQSVDVDSTEIMWVKQLSEKYPGLKKRFCKKYNVFLEELEKAMSS